MDNKQVRKLFNNFYHSNYKPNYKAIAEAMGLSYFSFIKWKNGQLEYSQESLDKILAFIQKKGA